MKRLAFYIRDSQEIDRRHEPPIPEAIRGSRRLRKLSTLRGPAKLADLQQGALCVSAQ